MILDIVVIAFIALSVFNGYKKGLVGILVSLVGFIIAIILAFILQGTVLNYANQNTQIPSTIEGVVKQGVTRALQDKQDNIQSSDKFYLNIINNFSNTNNVDEISYNVTQLILKGICFIFIFLVVSIIIFILQMFLDLAFSLPILKSVNMVGGIAASLLMALIKIWVILAIISLLSPLGYISSILSLINQSNLTNFLYNNNLILALLGSNKIL